MGQCLAPCVNEVDSSIYTQMEEAVTRFLNGDTKEIKDDLKIRCPTDDLEVGTYSWAIRVMANGIHDTPLSGTLIVRGG